MFAWCVFTVLVGGNKKESPHMGWPDMEKVQQLFPNNPVWKVATDGTGPSRIIKQEQANGLFQEMAAYYAVNDISAESYPVGSAGGTPVVSNLLNTFNELLGFFERECNCTCPPETKTAIEEKQADQRKREEEEEAAYKKKAIEVFQTLPNLGPPSEAQAAKLTEKLAEYRVRLSQQSGYRHPTLAATDPAVRESSYKITLVEALLHTDKKPVVLNDLMLAQMEKYGEQFDANELFQVCAVTAKFYLGVNIMPKKD